MINLKELRFKGIGRFVDEQVVDLSKLGNLIQIDGKNNNTNGSSGAAKSTVFNALDFLFGLNTIPNNGLQSRLTEEHMYVEVSGDLDGLPLNISRGKKLKIDIDGDITSGSSKITEEKLDQIIAIPRNIFRLILHKKQGEKGFFLSFTPKETSEFLTDCLGFGRFKKNLIDLDIKILNLSKKITTLEISCEANRSALKATQTALISIGLAPVKEVSQETALSLKQKAEVSWDCLERLKHNQVEARGLLEKKRPVSTLHIFDGTRLEHLKLDKESLKTQINQANILERERQNSLEKDMSVIKLSQVELKNKILDGQQASEKIQNLVQEIKKIRENVCFTCEQVWISEKVKQKELELLENIKKYKELVDKGNESIEFLAKRQKDLERIVELMEQNLSVEHVKHLNEKIAELDKEIQKERNAEVSLRDEHFFSQKTKQEEFNKLTNYLNSKFSIEFEQVNGQAMLDRKNFESAIMKMKMYEDSRGRYETSYKLLKEQEQSYIELVINFENELNQTKKSLETSEELKRGIKSYLSCSFDEALKTISQSATKMVRKVPNMANSTIQLVGIRETKEGRVKEEVNALLHLDGDENIDIRTLSGGERTSIDLAVDLSAIDLIEDKTNKGINLFNLDEPFNGLDTVCIEMALEVLKNASANKKLFIVDHNPEVKAMVESRLLVVRDGIVSKVVQN